MNESERQEGHLSDFFVMHKKNESVARSIFFSYNFLL